MSYDVTKPIDQDHAGVRFIAALAKLIQDEEPGIVIEPRGWPVIFGFTALVGEHRVQFSTIAIGSMGPKKELWRCIVSEVMHKKVTIWSTGLVRVFYCRDGTAREGQPCAMDARQFLNLTLEKLRATPLCASGRPGQIGLLKLDFKLQGWQFRTDLYSTAQ